MENARDDIEALDDLELDAPAPVADAHAPAHAAKRARLSRRAATAKPMPHDAAAHKASTARDFAPNGA